MKERIFKSAPLPFQGQKRNFAMKYQNALIEINRKQKINLIVDLFGGSGLLSHIAKRTLPHCQVIYNDFDDFHVRLKNVNKTNELISSIRELVINTARNIKIETGLRVKILEIIKNARETTFVDYITLSSSLLFSTNYVLNFKELEKATLYNNVRLSDYDFDPEEYLYGLDILKQDYKILYERCKDRDDVLFIIDPPYLSTDTSTYVSDKYWKLADYLDVLKVLNNSNYVYFTSNKSSLVELLEWFTLNYGYTNPFYRARLLTHDTHLTHNGKYTDMMFYKCKD